jgi:hypothetical protein
MRMDALRNRLIAMTPGLDHPCHCLDFRENDMSEKDVKFHGLRFILGLAALLALAGCIAQTEPVPKTQRPEGEGSDRQPAMRLPSQLEPNQPSPPPPSTAAPRIPSLPENRGPRNPRTWG